MRSIVLLALMLGGGAGAAGGHAPPDANFPACMGSAYDRCTDTTSSTDCPMGMTCRVYMGDGFTICTPTCSASVPCPPDKNGAVACNMQGTACKAQPNDCTP